MIAKKPRSPCYLWTGFVGRNGYGHRWCNAKKQPVGAHVVVWEEAHGPVPKGLYVCHRCDVKLCVRLDHMFLGTHKDNMADGVLKRRFKHGIEHWAAKLTPQKVRRARALRARGWIVREIAKAVGASHKSVSAVLTGRTWRHVA